MVQSETGKVGFEQCFEEKGRKGNNKKENSRYGHGDRRVLVIVGSRVVRLEQIFVFREMRVWGQVEC